MFAPDRTYDPIRARRGTRVASRFASKPFIFTPHAHRVSAIATRPAPDARPLTGLRKRTAARPAALGPARQVPTPA